MFRRRGIATSIGIIGLCCAAGGSAPQSLAAGTRAVTLDVEALGAWQLRNDVRSPNVAPSTRFALDALTGDGPFVAPRLQVTLPSGERSEWRLLAAPLSLTRDSLRPYVVVGLGWMHASANDQIQLNTVNNE